MFLFHSKCTRMTCFHNIPKTKSPLFKFKIPPIQVLFYILESDQSASLNEFDQHRSNEELNSLFILF